VNVNEVMKSLDPELGRLAESFRKVVKRSLPMAVEQVEWGTPVYSVGGKNVACIMCYDDHVSLGFFLGGKLTSKRLEGAGRGLRHIRGLSESETDERGFSHLLKKAVSLVE